MTTTFAAEQLLELLLQLKVCLLSQFHYILSIILPENHSNCCSTNFKQPTSYSLCLDHFNGYYECCQYRCISSMYDPFNPFTYTPQSQYQKTLAEHAIANQQEQRPPSVSYSNGQLPQPYSQNGVYGQTYSYNQSQGYSQQYGGPPAQAAPGPPSDPLAAFPEEQKV
jgi:hypothetical protein